MANRASLAWANVRDAHGGSNPDPETDPDHYPSPHPCPNPQFHVGPTLFQICDSPPVIRSHTHLAGRTPQASADLLREMCRSTTRLAGAGASFTAWPRWRRRRASAPWSCHRCAGPFPRSTVIAGPSPRRAGDGALHLVCSVMSTEGRAFHPKACLCPSCSVHCNVPGGIYNAADVWCRGAF